MKFYQAIAACGCAVAVWWMTRSCNETPFVVVRTTPQEVAVCGNRPGDTPRASYVAPSKGPDGKFIFQTKCASCHHALKDAAGPALKGAIGRAPNKEWVYAWIRNPSRLVASGDHYAALVFKAWGETEMTAFPELTDAQIDAVFAYVESWDHSMR